MLSEKLCKAFNAQINAELWSAYLYLSMSMDAAARGQKGVANWFKIQFQEEGIWKCFQGSMKLSGI